MDEVWKDINFTSFQEHSSINHHQRSTNFQHFLSLPFATTAPPNSASSGRYGQPVPPPATMLTLNNSAHELHFLKNTEPIKENPLIPQICPHYSGRVESFPNIKKRQQESDSSNSDRRHKRMIKNRDAAARSRARKQAYTDELELEVAYLVEENARLRKQHKQLCLAAADQQPEKHKFSRATSAPL